MPEDFYKVLRIGYQSDAKTIQKAFHHLAMELHPDKNPDDDKALERFKLLSEAYKTLSNPDKKRRYDLKLRYGYQPPKPVYSRPFRAKVYRRKRTFSRRAQILGGLSIVAILAVVITSSFLLLRYNARYNFQRGLSNFENKKYTVAYFNFKQSLGVFNPYQAAAHFLMADICYNQHAYEQLTSSHIQKAFNANPSDSIKGRLFYLEGKVALSGQRYDLAYTAFEESITMWPTLDSAYYQLGELDTFVFHRYDKALGHYQYLAAQNSKPYDAYIAMAYSYHQLTQYQRAIDAIDQCLLIREDIGMAYYLKGISAHHLNKKDMACDNYYLAGNLGMATALDSLASFCQEFEITAQFQN